MTDHDNYKKTFDAVAASKMRKLEAEQIMTTRKRYKRSMSKMAVVLVATFLLASLSCIAYANDLGGIQRKIQVWIRGELTDVQFNYDPDGTYQLSYTGENGEQKELGGGGVAYENGKERPATMEELMDELNAPNVEYCEDGKAVLFYQNQRMDITDKFHDGVCYLQINNQGTTLFVTVKYQNGLAMSPHRYLSPLEFN